MPYVDGNLRALLDGGGRSETAGELTYKLYSLVLGHGKGGRVAFADHAEVLGALEACKLEYYRRHVAPYEDLKREQNGDVS